jgi:hypothetical protein
MSSFARIAPSAALVCGLISSTAFAQETDPHAGHSIPIPGAAMSMGDPREASGTAWQPAESPASGVMWHRGTWMFMLHGNVFVQYIASNADRSARQAGSINWFMGMARRPFAGGALTGRVMTSLEPLTVGRCGYPDLVQTGESCRGVALHDRQHPHDMFMEVAAHYSRSIGGGRTLELYGGPAAEPALGPVAFPHRASAMAHPQAPVSHHWLDATHVSFGVVTAGLAGRRWKVEASAFNGREPDDARYGLDVAALDSVAARVWWTPADRWSLQISRGHLADVHHGENVRRTTASLAYHRAVDGHQWVTTVAWGVNSDHDGPSHALLVESAIDLTPDSSVAARFELVPRTAAELNLPGDPHDSFRVGKLQGTYSRRIGRAFAMDTRAGAGVGVAILGSRVAESYGTANPLEVSVFLRFEP